ncbi:hypothetical protein EC844_12835 [Acinetobacter calcoaceticus]|uniref:Uncharacterized protein n=1 Tax=Acinetobacter calcoaceticus TaxID=471 RepID=A0A4R1XCB9_ACICA|nr:hypothetical protein EC844_12835 [Acinetobacter calcoaceticus]
MKKIIIMVMGFIPFMVQADSTFVFSCDFADGGGMDISREGDMYRLAFSPQLNAKKRIVRNSRSDLKTNTPSLSELHGNLWPNMEFRRGEFRYHVISNVSKSDVNDPENSWMHIYKGSSYIPVQRCVNNVKVNLNERSYYEK